VVCDLPRAALQYAAMVAPGLPPSTRRPRWPGDAATYPSLLTNITSNPQSGEGPWTPLHALEFQAVVDQQVVMVTVPLVYTVWMSCTWT